MAYWKKFIIKKRHCPYCCRLSTTKPNQNSYARCSIPPSSIFIVSSEGDRTHLNIKLFSAVGRLSKTTIVQPWSNIKKIIEKFHKHVYGHANLSDMETLLKRNNLWSNEIEKYLSRITREFFLCTRTCEEKQPRKVSISSLNKYLNELSCVDHFHLGDLRQCHIMDATTRYSILSIVPDTEMVEAITILDSHSTS